MFFFGVYDEVLFLGLSHRKRWSGCANEFVRSDVSVKIYWAPHVRSSEKKLLQPYLGMNLNVLVSATVNHRTSTISHQFNGKIQPRVGETLTLTLTLTVWLLAAGSHVDVSMSRLGLQENVNETTERRERATIRGNNAITIVPSLLLSFPRPQARL